MCPVDAGIKPQTQVSRLTHTQRQQQMNTTHDKSNQERYRRKLIDTADKTETKLTTTPTILKGLSDYSSASSGACLVQDLQRMTHVPAQDSRIHLRRHAWLRGKLLDLI